MEDIQVSEGIIELSWENWNISKFFRSLDGILIFDEGNVRVQ